LTSQSRVIHAGKVHRRAVYQLKRKASRGILYALLIGWAVVTTYPFVWLVLASLKHGWELFQNPFGLPKEWVFKNYAIAWTQAHVGELSLHSLIVTVVSTVLAMFLAATCAFILSRFNFRLKSLVWAYILFGFMVPDSVRLLPLAQFTRKLGIYDNLLGLALVYAASGVPWNTFFISSFMETIPRELEEAAVMDGASMWRVFWSVILPLSRPAIVTMATFHVLYAWNEFILALLLTGSPAARTLPVGLRFLESQFRTNEPAIAAGIMVAVIPAVLFFLFLQRYVVKGMTAGSLAGM